MLAQVYNSAGEVVRSLYSGYISAEPSTLLLTLGAILPGQSTVLQLPGQTGSGTAVAWTGVNQGGQAVAPGFYYVKVELTDPFGATTSLTQPVTVLPAPGQAWISVSNSAGETVWRTSVAPGAAAFSHSSWALVMGLTLLAAALGVAGGARSVLYKIVAMAGVGTTGVSGTGVGITVTLAGGGTQVLGWDGTNGQGLPVAPGVYTVALVSSQAGSSTLVQTTKVDVLRGPDGKLLSGAVLGPDPATGGSASLRYDPSNGLAAHVTVYTLAGERVAGADDWGLSGSVDLDLHRLASGIYVCEARQGTMRRVMKLAVVR